MLKNKMRDQNVERLASLILDAIGSHRSRDISQSLAAGDWMSVLNASIDPKAYDSFSLFARDYCAVELLRKYPSLPSGINTEKAAKESFWAAEKHCYVTNQRLYRFVYGTNVPEDDGIAGILPILRKNVIKLIGKAPPPNWRNSAGFGPGATYDDRGKKVLTADKLENRPTATKSVLTRLENEQHWLGTKMAMLHAWPSIVPGNRFTTVPKTAKTDRGICIEPSLNLFYQKGLGLALRGRLKRAGIDLERGQELNGSLALFGSDTGQYSTVDLSSASDTVCTALVELIVPPRWYEELDSLRCSITEIDGRRVRLEKFSSMGNGFTFELETVLFTAIAMTAYDLTGAVHKVGQNLLVYGDDIIVQANVTNLLIKMLAYFGFIPNPRKTFCEGYFRESCGTDAFGGQAVKPLRLDSDPTDFSWWISTANGIKRMALSLDAWECTAFKRAWRFAVQQVPLRHRLFGPERIGDGVIHAPQGMWSSLKEGEAFTSTHRCAIPNTYWIRANAVRTEPVGWAHWKEEVMLAARLLTIGDYSEGLTGRGCRTSHVITWVSVS